jgi:formylmethanofuran dehydrogenase subunit E
MPTDISVSQRIRIASEPYENFIKRVEAFHGHIAPGLVIGGFMVDLAMAHFTKGELFDALCETRACLPDAIQLLTPCTIGNGWLKIIDMGRFALTLYEKRKRQGIRVAIDPEKLKTWPEINTWFFKLLPKNEQDRERLMNEIKTAGPSICMVRHVTLNPKAIRRQHRDRFHICPVCHESFPAGDGGVCLGCRGQSPYMSDIKPPSESSQNRRELKAIPVEQAAGQRALHDMTRIVPGRKKGPEFKRHQLFTEGDICRLQKMGRQQVYVVEKNQPDPEWVHEDEAAGAFSKAMAGWGVSSTENPSEGKAELIADEDGLLLIDTETLSRFNQLPNVVCASRHRYSVVKRGDQLAGTRALPLFMAKDEFEQALAILAGNPLFQIQPLKPIRVGILVTGTEIFRGLVEDRFIPIIRKKVEAYQCHVVKAVIVPDERRVISESVADLITTGAELIVTTAGLSVDPDDVTRQGLMDAGITGIQYGVPILPGNMTMMAYRGDVKIIGVPACALYHEITGFDILLPRILAGISITNRDLAEMGHGSMCLNCRQCIYPQCPLGK